MKRKLRETPNWLRVVRRLYTYLGGGSLVTILSYFKLTKDEIIFAMEIYLFGMAAIQAICDVSFKKEKLEPLTPDRKV